MAPPDPFKLVGTIVDGRYRVERVAGSGGYGVVYRAFHLSFESPIALKVLKVAEDAASDRIKAFQREGKVLFELSSLHPSIVKALETGLLALFDGSVAPYLALEWLDGVSLDQEMKHRRKLAIVPMTLPQVLTLLDGPAEALALAHARGIVHRDIKPGNLFVTRRSGLPMVKILDFGVAKMLDDSMSTTTKLAHTGPVSSFTPMYASPEQWLRRLGATGTWTDVHAWALVCVELLTGKVPLAGAEAAQYMAACLDAEVRPTPKALGLQVPPEIEQVFVRGLAVNPRDRFRDVSDFWRALCGAAGWSRDDMGSPSVSIEALTAIEDPAYGEQLRAADGKAEAPGANTTRATASRSVQVAARTSPARRAIAGLTAGVLFGCLVVVASLRNRNLNATPVRAADPAKEVNASSGHDKSVQPESLSSPLAAHFELPEQRPLPINGERPSGAPPAGPRRGRASSTVPSQAPSSSGSHSTITRVDAGVGVWAVASVPTPPSKGRSAVPDSGVSLDQVIGNEELMHRR